VVRRRRRIGPGAGLLFAVVLIVGGLLYANQQDFGSSTPAPAPPAAATSTPAAAGPTHVPAGTLDVAAARATVLTLKLAAKGTLTGYQRSCASGSACVFGPAWADVDHNGCDTRNDILRRDLSSVQAQPGTHDCVVILGTLVDPYTGVSIAFKKAHAGLVQIDHVVPLAAAWAQGAATWTKDQRQTFANDPGNLLATGSAPNESKGDSTADEWLPPNTAFGCTYARIIITVKQHYQLTVTSAEVAALQRLLTSC
jgi:Protein of unknown function (DUF1524)